MTRLTATTRKEIPTGKFAGPDRSYPDEDASHARDALAMVSRYGSPAVKAEVRANVHRDWPGIGKGKKSKEPRRFGTLA